MGRTLYVNRTSKAAIFRDGPSVWIKEEGKAGRRIPARLVGRVVIIGNVKLDAGAITLFADNNIPVTLMDNRSEETAVVIPYNHRLPNHYREQKRILDSDKNIEHYIRWAEAKRALLQLNLIKRFLPALAHKLKYTGFGEGNYQEILKGLKNLPVRQAGVNEEKWAIVNGIITNIFRNMIIEGLLKSDLDPHTGIIHRKYNFGLALDICFIMGGESDLQCLQFFRSANLKELLTEEDRHCVVTNEGIRNIVHRFENKRKGLKNKLDNIIDELFIVMREIRA